MYRQSAPTDFFVDVDGIGNFSFAQRKIKDHLAIAAAYSRLTEGVETPTAYLDSFATWVSTLAVLTVTAPAGWNIDEMDPLDDGTTDKLGAVFMALRLKEHSFRQNKAEGSKAQRPGDGEVAGVLVPPQVQPGAD